MDRVGGVLVETYRVERLIAEGSMGSVYEARHLRIPKRFAVKFLRIGLEDNSEALQRFRREAEVVATLEHPNIVGLYDYNVAEDGVPYIVLEFLDGEHLGARLRRDGKQSLDETLRIVECIGAALTTAHARNVIHRDLKPDNVILCASGGGVKVVDFGVAKLRGAPELTAVNTIVGTVPYMAPEQLMGGVLDARVDQYALATIAYELLAGEMAFDGRGTVADVARRVLTHQPPFIAGVPQAVNQVVFRGMARAADDRFPSVSEFVAALMFAAAADSPSLTVGELPPLDGEATRITAAGDGPEAASSDEEDPVAPPPDDAAPPKEGRTPTIPAPLPILDGPSGEVTNLDAADANRERYSTTPPPLASLVLERPSQRAVTRPPVDEPRVTLKTMAAATEPKGWEAVAGERTRTLSTPARLRWLIIGLLLGVAAGTVTVLLLRPLTRNSLLSYEGVTVEVRPWRSIAASFLRSRSPAAVRRRRRAAR